MTAVQDETNSPKDLDELIPLEIIHRFRRNTAIVLAMLFFGVLVGYIVMARDTRQTAQWTLTEARVVAHTMTEKNSGADWSSVTGNCLRVHLQYQFRAQVMTSVLQMSDSCSVGAPLEAERSTYTIGNIVRVFVDPNDPLKVRSLDYPQLSPTVLLLVLVVELFILILIGIVLGSRHRPTWREAKAAADSGPCA